MISDVDDFFMDMEVFSSPIIDRTQYEQPQEYNYELNNTNYIDFQMLDDNAQPYEYNSISPVKKYYENSEKLAFPTPIVKPLPNVCLTPKPKKQPLVFQPFASFDATELTVKALKERISVNKSCSLIL